MFGYMDLVCAKCLISTFICIVLKVNVVFLGQSQINYYLIGPVPHASVSFLRVMKRGPLAILHLLGTLP